MLLDYEISSVFVQQVGAVFLCQVRINDLRTFAKVAVDKRAHDLPDVDFFDHGAE